MYQAGRLNEWLLVSQIVGYAAGTSVVVLLLVLVRRASRFEDTRRYALLVWSAMLWNAGHLAFTLALTAGWPFDGTLVRITIAVAFSGAMLSPAGALLVWQQSDRGAPEPGTAALGVPLVRVSGIAGGVLALLMWHHLFRERGLASDHALLWTLGAYHVATFFAFGALFFYKAHGASVAARVAIGMAVVGAFGVGLSVVLQKGALAASFRSPEYVPFFELVRQISTHLMTLGALFLFARFRFADVFIRQSLRTIAAAGLGVLSMMLFASPAVAALGFSSPQARAAALAGGALLIAALVASFNVVDGLIVALVDRGLFRQPDYGDALRRLRDALAGEHTDLPLHAAASTLVRETLALDAVRVVAIEGLDAPLREALTREAMEGLEPSRRATIVEQPFELLIPVRAGGDVPCVLAVTPSRERPTFLATELDFLRAAAAALGHRLDLVHREQEEIARRTHEAHLQQQLSDATLRALQAQVNPHFLFNTLNTIAHLIQECPGSAEAMTLRLAEVFNHVLTRGDRPFNSVSEEMDFLRTYLTIEEARFGDRLRVRFAIEPDAARAAIPSLILQPAVENALKHGLARKIGPGHLTISAAVEGSSLRLSIEDDGVGPGQAGGTIAEPVNGASRASKPHRPGRHNGGVGLRNIAERLRTLYGDRASLDFHPGPGVGSVVTLRLPFRAHDAKPAD